MSSPRSPLPLISRRQLLVGGAAAAGVAFLGGCGGDDDGGGAAASTTTTSAGAAAGGLALAQFFGGPMFVAGQPARLPFGVADADGLLAVGDTPATLSVQILDPDGTAVGEPIDVERHAEGLPRAYFPLEVTLADPGIYTARTEVGGAATEMSFQIDAAADVKVLQPGAAMPALETPTVADARGVKPVCTREPACPLHDVTVAEALGEGQPLALLVATPAFCQIAICGPVLDVLLDAQAAAPEVRFLHAEVYADPAKGLDAYAPAVQALGLHFEPCLFLVGPDGTVVDRVDTIYDSTELTTRLGRIATP